MWSLHHLLITCVASASEVVELRDATFDAQVNEGVWIVAFTAPWCGYCKKLIPEWDAASIETKGLGVKLGNVDATANQRLAERFQVQSYPTIKVFTPDNRDGFPYEGPRTAPDIVAFATKTAMAHRPPPEVTQLTDSKIFDTQCAKVQLCFIAFLPHIANGGKEQRDAYLETLQAIATRYKREFYGWLWNVGGDRPEFEAAFDVSEFSYPALIVYNHKKAVYSSHRGAFTTEGIHEFVMHRGKGAQPARSTGFAEDIGAVEAWDGSDYVFEEIEEEFDLSELDDIDDEHAEL